MSLEKKTLTKNLLSFFKRVEIFAPWMNEFEMLMPKYDHFLSIKVLLVNLQNRLIHKYLSSFHYQKQDFVGTI